MRISCVTLVSTLRFYRDNCQVPVDVIKYNDNFYGQIFGVLVDIFFDTMEDNFKG